MKLCTEVFDLRVERFCSSICGTMYEVVNDFILLFVDSGRDCIESVIIKISNFIIPLLETF